MTTLKELKAKYSSQAVPDWELVRAGLKEPEAPIEPEKRKPGRPRKEEVTPDGDSDAN